MVMQCSYRDLSNSKMEESESGGIRFIHMIKLMALKRISLHAVTPTIHRRDLSQVVVVHHVHPSVNPSSSRGSKKVPVVRRLPSAFRRYTTTTVKEKMK
jgi:hypothetical protein